MMQGGFYRTGGGLGTGSGCPGGHTGQVTLRLVIGDISAFAADAVVNAANSSLLGGGGVDGAIHRAGGPSVLAACRELRATSLPDGLPTGHAVATTAGDLPARWVIHAVGPVYRGRVSDPVLLASAYRESLQLARELGATSVALPAISAGAYGYPLSDAAQIAVREASLVDDLEVTFVLFGQPIYEAFREAAELLGVPARN